MRKHLYQGHSVEEIARHDSEKDQPNKNLKLCKRRSLKAQNSITKSQSVLLQAFQEQEKHWQD